MQAEVGLMRLLEAKEENIMLLYIFHLITFKMKLLGRYRCWWTICPRGYLSVFSIDSVVTMEDITYIPI